MLLHETGDGSWRDQGDIAIEDEHVLSSGGEPAGNRNRVPRSEGLGLLDELDVVAGSGPNICSLWRNHDNTARDACLGHSVTNVSQHRASGKRM
jgi:hypothetical protein